MSKILIIDDDPDVRKVISLLLEDEISGMSVITAGTGIEGIEKAKADLPDTILLDVDMPGIDGLETCKRLKSDEDTKHIPIIIATGVATDPSSKIKGLEAGADSFLCKPIDKPELIAQAGVALRIKKAEDSLRNQKVLLEDEVRERTKALTDISDRYQALFERSLECVFINDFLGNFIDANQASLDLLGYTKEEIRSINFASLLSEDQIPEALKLGEEIVKSGFQKDTSEFRLRRKDGGYVYVETKASLLYHDEVPFATQGVARDITGRKKAEDKLRESETRYRSVFENTGTATIITEEDTTISMANTELEKLSGYLKEEIEGKMSWTEFIDKEDLERTKEYHVKRREKGGNAPTKYEFRFVDKQGNIKDTLVNVGVIPGTKKSVASLTDITERKKAEDKLKKAHKDLEASNKELAKSYTELKASQSQLLQSEKMAAIGQLAAGVAHEINNPMGFISSNLGTLGKYVDRLTEFIGAQTEVIEALEPNEALAGLEQKKKELKLDYIIKDIKDLINESSDGAGRVKKIVQDLKSFSRVDEEEYRDVDINECIETTINIIWNELKYKCTVKKEYGDIPPTKCYPQQLNQVFMNLLVNASQAIEKKGEITIKSWLEDGSINVSISDTGSGIPEENLGKLFEPFFTTKDVGKGTGLGLSITYGIIKKHGGEIKVESQVGKGAAFVVSIPVVEGA